MQGVQRTIATLILYVIVLALYQPCEHVLSVLQTLRRAYIFAIAVLCIAWTLSMLM